MLVDNTTAVENLKRLAGNQGFGAAVTQGEGVFSVAFTRTGCAACEEAVSAPLPPPAETGPCLWAGIHWGRRPGAGRQPDAHVLLHSGPGGGQARRGCSS